MERLRKLASVILMFVAIGGMTVQITGCSKAENSSEPNSGPEADPDAGMDVELPD